MLSIKIILLSMAAAMTFGILHDMVTAHVCVEYFTVGHPIIIPTKIPILLALFWGVWATWWVGLMLGIPLSMVCQLGSRPIVGVAFLLKPLLVLMTIAGLAALIAGVIGWLLARNDLIQLTDYLAEHVPPQRHARFLADGFAHTASYAVASVGGLILMAWVWYQRGRINTV